MQITSKFTIAVHILTAIAYFGESEQITSKFLAGSIGANPVIVRGVMGKLKEAGLIRVSQGKSGIKLAKSLEAITLYEVYEAVGGAPEGGIFHFHEHPNPACPVGRHIHEALVGHLEAAQKALEASLKGVSLSAIVAAIEGEMRAEERAS